MTDLDIRTRHAGAVSETTGWQSEQWTLAIEGIATGRHVLLHGRHGNGKTFGARTLMLNGRESFGLTLTPDTESAAIRGHWLPTREASSLAEIAEVMRDAADALAAAGGAWSSTVTTTAGPVDLGAVSALVGSWSRLRAGEWSWHDGPAIRAFRTGGRFVVDEIGEASGDVLTLSYALTETPETARLGMILPSGETVAPRDGYQMIATTNVDPKLLPVALVSRFLVIRVDDPAPAGIDALPEDLREFAIASGTQTDQARYIPLRAFRTFAEIRDRTSTPDVALALAFGRDRAPEIRDAMIVGGIS